LFYKVVFQAAGLSEGHISALLALQSKYGTEMKELGHLHKESRKSKLNPEDRWKSWVSLKLKMRAFNEKQKILLDLKRDRQAEKYG